MIGTDILNVTSASTSGKHAAGRCAKVALGKPPSHGDVVAALREDPSPTHRNCGEACAVVGGGIGSIAVNKSWWRGLNQMQKDCVMAHETAHTEGILCERCADFRAGQILRSWGFPRESVAPTFDALVQSRPTAGADALKGFDTPC